MPREDVTGYAITDHQLKHIIIEAISWDPRVHYPTISVIVDAGIVFLSGEVSTPAEKAAVGEDAIRAPGVTQVINNITVVPKIIGGDEELESSIRKALSEDGRVDASHLEVAVQNRIAVIRGEAITPLEKRAALDDAASVHGLEQVIDEIDMLPEAAPNDHMLEELVYAQLERAVGLDEKKIHPHVEKGVVHLSGYADFLQQKVEAGEIAEQTPGVTGVVNDIIIAC
jgi:osmotically-inducible protein OsmY